MYFREEHRRGFWGKETYGSDTDGGLVSFMAVIIRGYVLEKSRYFLRKMIFMLCQRSW